ncbi:MAG: hypothetical protein KJO41_09295 [Bacteroidia bacterium]|nr:hypothetical protein [Bacteroidia bacterium]NND24777.1 hypothetical protein [Flavobacteriaceae bacterium]NNM35654.1 hypothetical protein [Nitrosopumilus sp.]MBT8279186.1 hypothetical protein [Bacteroidia bacterium]NNK60874.1 hypothetical protein [Flavobacteriaceae bacterium]
MGPNKILDIGTITNNIAILIFYC